MAETITVHALFGKAVLQDIAINRLHSSAYQLRELFSEEGLTSLAATIDQQLTEQLGFPLKVAINKNESGSFRIPFHSREPMQNILEKLGCHSIAMDSQE